MEHEVFVPVPVPSLRRTLGDPVRVARCVPGLQQDADASADPLSGRLRIRVDGHTITYRGALRLADGAEDGAADGAADGAEGEPEPESAVVLVTGEGTEARGGGSARLRLTVRLTGRDGGTAIGFAGTADGEGRILDLDAAAALAAARRLLDRFAQQLVTETLAGGGDAGAATGTGAAERSVGEAVEQAIEEAAEEADTTGASPADGAGDDDAEPLADGPGNPPGTGSVFDAPVPPPSLDPVPDVEFTVPEEPPAEAAHARRTMIGRSAEEVDHAPPRGRYAPVPSPDSANAGAALRWVVPAAAFALASAVVVTRALRRRR
ncbi:carbon monoxide dehydrogenase [Streptomyces sp. NPDC058195]|uniref:carbon monoxide dehydrogenase n=1 Tax=Streptomyces sp. NPDC058195 TaxID=3346375 RepID=UPI0036E09B6D